MKEKLIEQLEKLSGKKVVLKEEIKGPGQIKMGDIILLPTKYGKDRFIVLSTPSWGRSIVRAEAVLERDKEKYKSGEAKNYYGLTLRPGGNYEVVGTVKSDEWEEIKTGQRKVSDSIAAKKKERTDVLHGKFDYKNPENTTQGVLNWDSTGRRQKLTLQNGDVVYPGDTVAVRFSNGIFNMILGNEAGMIANLSGWSSRTGMIFVKQSVWNKKARSVPYDRVLRKV